MKCSIRWCAPVRKLLCFAAALLCVGGWSQEAKVRTSIGTNDVNWVGQKVAVIVELLAPGFFASAASFELPNPRGVLLMPPTEHPVVSSETISGTSYTVQRHELSAFATRAGEQSIPAFKVRFAFKSAPLDTNETRATVATTPLTFKAQLPPGAENLGIVISAKGLKIEETWQPEPGTTNVLAGAAFTRTVTFSAPDVPGMAFPPFPAGKIDGLGIYLKRQVLDQSDRGALRGERRDVITYVCQRSGEFTIPAARLVWFDLDGKQLHTNDFPARTLQVAPNPALATTNNGAASTTGLGRTTTSPPPLSFVQRHWLSLLIVMILIVAGAVWGWPLVAPELIAALRPLHLAKLNPSDGSISTTKFSHEKSQSEE